MVTNVKVSATTCGALIPLGRCMEDDVRNIVFDCSSLAEDFGEGTAALVHQRSQDAAPYIINMTADGTTYTWEISNTDTAFPGIGSLELRWTTSDGLGKSVTYRTQVLPSITGDTTIPDPLESWYDAMVDYIDENSISEEDLENAIAEYLEEHPVTSPVTSVNSKTGDVVLDANDVGAYAVPSGGIPKSDLASAVQTSLGKADTALQSAPVTSVNSKTGDVSLNASDVGAYELPSGGIPKTDLASAVQTSLGKADTALQTAPVTSVNSKTGAVTLSASDVGAYSKPSGGIPKTDLESAVQTSLGKADTALQSAPVTSVNSQTGDVTISVPTKTSDLTNDSGFGTYSKPSGGIPKTDLASAVQTSLGKADTALQTAPVSSVDGKTGAVTVLPTGGTTGQVLKKTSGTNYAVEWANESGGSSSPEIFVGSTTPSGYTLYIDPDGFLTSGEGVDF